MSKNPKKPAAPPSDPQPDPGPVHVDHRPAWVGGIRVVKDIPGSEVEKAPEPKTK